MYKGNVVLRLLALFVISFVLSSCSLLAKQADITTETPTVTISGRVSLSGEMITISDNEKTTEITSRKIDLKQYVGEKVTVVGEYSGTTLFVDEVR